LPSIILRESSASGLRNIPIKAPKTKRSAAIVAALLLIWVSPVFAGPVPWPDASYVRRLVVDVLPETSEQWDGYEFAQRGSRGATYIAAGLLWRDGPHDRAAATRVLRGVLNLQYQDGPDSKLHGVWRRRQGETDHDSNWREFVGCGLILILETFPDRLPADLVDDIKSALLRAAQGAASRDVGADYTNIALMSAFLLDYVGTKQGRTDLQQAGRKKAEAIYELFSRHKTFDEYNSPTYYGTDLMALALWRKHACSERLRELGRSMEADLWRDIGTFYHAGMRNMCGPFVRAYGMDMTQYCALTGLWIALAVQDPALAPWPATGGRHQGERVYAPVFALLGAEVPEEVMPHLLRFAGERTFERTFRDTKATVLMEKKLMMGAAFLKRQWDQHHPATIYWQAVPGEPVGWILLTGLNDSLRPVVAERRLRVYRESKSDEPIQLLVSAPGLDQTQITPDRWNLPGLTVAVEVATGVKLSRVRWIDHSRYGRCLEVLFSATAQTEEGEEVMSLKPEQ
jgi:hypothetical protein